MIKKVPLKDAYTGILNDLNWAKKRGCILAIYKQRTLYYVFPTISITKEDRDFTSAQGTLDDIKNIDFDKNLLYPRSDLYYQLIYWIENERQTKLNQFSLLTMEIARSSLKQATINDCQLYLEIKRRDDRKGNIIF